MEQVFFKLYAWQMVAADKLRSRRESGQGALEYVGMIAVAAVIVLAVLAAIKGPTISNWISDIIRDLTSGTDPNPATKPGG